MRKRNISQAEAKAYKTKAEGKAIQVTAWMPLMILLVLLTAIFLAPTFGVDLAPFAEALTAIPVAPLHLQQP